MRIAKAHAYGNDFLYITQAEAAASRVDPPALARQVCARHTGLGADGLILYDRTERGARMRLVNADGSHAEVSGNGVRGLGALLAWHRGAGAGVFEIETDAGVKRLDLLERATPGRYVFDADMGVPAAIDQLALEVAGERVSVVRLDMGNPQCVVLGPLDVERLGRLGPALQRHHAFPHGVNVELAHVASPRRVEILIWERGVGPTQSSGTGSCAAAVAAIVAGGAERQLEVVAPGGAQQVDWTAPSIRLTGWAEVVFEGAWLATPVQAVAS